MSEPGAAQTAPALVNPCLRGADMAKVLPGDTPEQKLLLNHTVDPDTGCWRWTGGHDDAGYGHITFRGRSRGAHRAAYILWVGEIPDGLHVDHVYARGCRHRDCINPAHLEAVTSGENTRRGFGITGRNGRATQCAKGHPLSGDNLIMRTHAVTGHAMRTCRECANDLNRQYYARQAAGGDDGKPLLCPCGRRFDTFHGLRTHQGWRKCLEAS